MPLRRLVKQYPSDNRFDASTKALILSYSENFRQQENGKLCSHCKYSRLMISNTNDIFLVQPSMNLIIRTDYLFALIHKDNTTVHRKFLLN